MSKNPLDRADRRRLTLAILVSMGMIFACGPAGMMTPVTGQQPANTPAPEALQPPAATPASAVESPAELQQCQNAAFLPLSLADRFGSGAKLPQATQPSQPVIKSPANGSLLPLAPLTLTYRLGDPPSPDYRYSISITFGRADELYLSSETYLPPPSGEADIGFVWNPPAPGNYYLLLTAKYVRTDGAPSPTVKDIVAEGGSISLFLCFKVSTAATPSASMALTCTDRAAMLTALALGPAWGFDPAIPAPPDPVITQPPAEANLPPGPVTSVYELGLPPSADWVYQTTTVAINTRDLTTQGPFESLRQVSGNSGLTGNIPWTADSPGTYLVMVWAQYVKIQGPVAPEAIVARGPYSYGFACFTVR